MKGNALAFLARSSASPSCTEGDGTKGLSNTSRRRAFALAKLPSLGFDSQRLAGFICSGEQAPIALPTAEPPHGRAVH